MCQSLCKHDIKKLPAKLIFTSTPPIPLSGKITNFCSYAKMPFMAIFPHLLYILFGSLSHNITHHLSLSLSLFLFLSVTLSVSLLLFLSLFLSLFLLSFSFTLYLFMYLSICLSLYVFLLTHCNCKEIIASCEIIRIFTFWKSSRLFGSSKGDFPLFWFVRGRPYSEVVRPFCKCLSIIVTRTMK